MKLKKLPIGISTLKEIIEEEYVYVDKTKIVLDLIENGKYYFLSRPRRFGKSLFLDTLKTVFQGDKEVFKGLYIYDRYDFKPYPILKISFGSSGVKTKEDLYKEVDSLLRYNQKQLNLECSEQDTFKFCFKTLIEEAYEKYNQKVVILIDEYDKPILDCIEDTKNAKEIRDELKNFYSVIKDSDEYIKFVFITGVSKFSKVSLFSGLNNIEDITLNPNYATICGYRQEDVESTFKNHLKGADFEKIKLWYNGYKWLGEGVYNPFDILLFISNNKAFRNYWFSTATPTFLLKLIEKNNYFLPNLEYIVKDDKMLDSFDVDYIELETLMWQTGYLTITDTKENYDGTPKYILNIPNQEVRLSLIGSIADFMSKINNSTMLRNDIYEALLENNFAKLERNLKSIYAAIPYNLFTKNPMYEREGYYVSVFYAYIKALGLELIGEDVTNKGRIDLTIKLPESIIIIEFKVDGTSAISQIKEKGYHQKYLSETKPIYIVGIEFDKEDRNISKLQWEKI